MDVARRAGQADLYRHPPASMEALVAHTRRGDWVPGERHRALEATGHVYGWLVAIPVSAVLYGAAWVLQRPTRVLIVAVLCAVAWMTV